MSEEPADYHVDINTGEILAATQETVGSQLMRALYEAVTTLRTPWIITPYGTWKNFKRRGYTIEEVPQIEAQNPPDWVACGRNHP